MPPYNPWVSVKQERLANSGRMPGLKASDLAGKNAVSKGRKLPMRHKARPATRATGR